jgi:hypothetical protein
MKIKPENNGSGRSGVLHVIIQTKSAYTVYITLKI